MNKQTGLEFMRTASAEEIAKVISEEHRRRIRPL